MTARSSIALFALALFVAPAVLAEDGVMKHQGAKDPAALKAGAGQTKAATAKPAAPPPPTGAEVGQAVDAMAGSCTKALQLHTEIAALAGKVKASKAARQKSNAEMKKKLRAVKATHGKVTRASKKPGTEAATMVEAARTDYESALAESKTFEVETQTVQASEDQLLKLVTLAEEASTACSKYEETVRAAAAHAKKAVADAKRNAAKARTMAAIRQEKALAAERAKQAKELEAVKRETEGARTAFETMKGEAAQQPAPGAATTAKSPNAASPVKDPAAANQGKKGEAPGQVKKQ
jgi:hypothetical protein